ncbi:ribosome assembly cofactor RimP [Palleniella muris]|uniref:Ribosome assembly cofactor RimP n=1 Tax=Palleniella muris TaxID=3038145 RepID=A0AC61QVD3_9BACT|nr:ribosome assembly cofactor RimP [Palleniella muris]TGX84178.1 ribosome assembly cofactor RimP [Palleniella muris]
MINKETVRTLVNEWLKEKEYFLVDVEVTPDDRIVVEIDHKDGVWIEDCAQLSRFLEENLNRDEEDYELEVGSAGLGQPFKVVQQYINCIGEEVEVLRKDGKKHTGILKSVDEPKFVVTVKEKKRLEGQKRPQMVETDIEFDMNEVKHTKYVLKFK